MQKGVFIIFSASYFTYDGIYSGEFGLQLADFNADSVTDTQIYDPTIITSKSSRSKVFIFHGATYDSLPQCEMCMLTEAPIHDINRRAILSWLTGVEGFKQLIIHQPDLERYEYKCIFSNIRSVYVNGRCHGFRVTANFNSPYQTAKNNIITINSSDGGTQTIVMNNESDMTDDYIYPTIVATISNGGSIRIINKTDDPERVFLLSGLLANETVTIDNNYRKIVSSTGSTRLGNFSKRWFRLLPGKNDVEITVNGMITISYPTLAMVGF